MLAEHPLRTIRALTDETLRSMSAQLQRLYSTTDRPSFRRSSCGARLMEGAGPQPVVPVVRRVGHGRSGLAPDDLHKRIRDRLGRRTLHRRRHGVSRRKHETVLAALADEVGLRQRDAAMTIWRAGRRQPANPVGPGRADTPPVPEPRRSTGKAPLTPSAGMSRRRIWLSSARVQGVMAKRESLLRSRRDGDGDGFGDLGAHFVGGGCGRRCGWSGAKDGLAQRSRGRAVPSR